MQGENIFSEFDPEKAAIVPGAASAARQPKTTLKFGNERQISENRIKANHHIGLISQGAQSTSMIIGNRTGTGIRG